MKKIGFFSSICLLLSLATWAQTKTGWVSIQGNLKNFSNQDEIVDLSDLQYLLPPTVERLIIPDSKSTFSIKFKLIAPNYFRLGRNILYLSPGDVLTVSIDSNDPNMATFVGRGAEANLYLRATPYPKGGSFIEAGDQVKPTPAETIKAIEHLAEARTQALAAVKNVTAEFRRLENARIKADLINSYYSGEDYSHAILKLKGEQAKAFSIQYQQLVAPKIAQYGKGFVDASFMKMVVYRDIAADLIKAGGKPADVQAIKDWYAASSLVKAMQKTSDKAQLRSFKAKVDVIVTQSYKDAVLKMWNTLAAFGKGDAVIDFKAVDINGNSVSLNDLKGKAIYVDLWATWCGPCMEEMPHFEKLKQKYKDNPNIAFVSLSLDDTLVGWKTSVTDRKADGYQWIVNRNLLKAYNIVGIPRSLLIDRNFKIADMNAPMPSEEAAVKAIDALLN